MKTGILLAGAAALVVTGAAWAKLPPAPPADPAKAAAAKQAADDTAKKDAELLGKAQDRAVANYKRSKGGAPAETAGRKSAKKK